MEWEAWEAWEAWEEARLLALVLMLATLPTTILTMMGLHLLKMPPTLPSNVYALVFRTLLWDLFRSKTHYLIVLI